VKEYQIKVWQGQQLGKEICIDTETDIQPFHTRDHKMITCQAYDGKDTVFFVERKNIRKFFNLHKDSTLIFQNAPFDVGVLNKITGMDMWYDRYDRNLIRDTKILYKLYNLAAIGMVPFKSSLAAICLKLLGRNIDKDDSVRCTFDQYEGWDILDIPEKHLKYAADDAVHTYDAYCTLLGLISNHDDQGTLLSHDIQVKGDWALDQIYKNGIGFDLSGRDEWLSEIDKKMKVQEEKLAIWGWVRGKPGIKQIYEGIVTMLGIADNLPRSEKSNDISAKSADLEEYRSMPFVGPFLDYRGMEKARSFVEPNQEEVIHPKYNVIVETGRTSCSKPNIQQLPRMGGVRELFKPKGQGKKKFIITDYSAIELSTLAQVCLDKFGYSVMAEKINEGKDLHRYYASVLFNKEEKDVTKDERQKAKAANFGFPGGLGIHTFITFARGYGLELTEYEAQKMKDSWFSAFPEMTEYMKNEQGYVFTRTGRKRGDTTFCAEKNTPFQGLASDGAKLALYEATKKGLEVVAFVHDEVVIEAPDSDIETYKKQLEETMIASMQKVVPDVRIGVESTISEVYTK